MLSHPKQIEIVAGPNGSGKTTFAEAFFKLRNGNGRFINPDVIAAGLSQGHGEQASFHAGRILLTAIEDAIKRGESFAFESTLSGKTWLSILKKAKQEGYDVIIYFLFLKKVDINLRRIRGRVKDGGHNIPQETVLRRYPRAFDNFWKLYRDFCSDWFIFDNSNKKPSQIHSKTSFEELTRNEKQVFENLFLQIGKIK